MVARYNHLFCWSYNFEISGSTAWILTNKGSLERYRSELCYRLYAVWPKGHTFRWASILLGQFWLFAHFLWSCSFQISGSTSRNLTNEGSLERYRSELCYRLYIVWPKGHTLRKAPILLGQFLLLIYLFMILQLPNLWIYFTEFNKQKLIGKVSIRIVL